MSVWTTMMFFCRFQMEVTFNFLEIRAMNTYPEHQVTLKFISFPAVWTFIAVQSVSIEKLSCPHTGCH